MRLHSVAYVSLPPHRYSVTAVWLGPGPGDGLSTLTNCCGNCSSSCLAAAGSATYAKSPGTAIFSAHASDASQYGCAVRCRPRPRAKCSRMYASASQIATIGMVPKPHASCRAAYVTAASSAPGSAPSVAAYCHTVPPRCRCRANATHAIHWAYQAPNASATPKRVIQSRLRTRARYAARSTTRAMQHANSASASRFTHAGARIVTHAYAPAYGNTASPQANATRMAVRGTRPDGR
jgi:hypothetical protein